MKITFVTPPPNLSGGMRVIAIYAERLKRRGHDVSIVYPPAAQPTRWQKLKSLVRGHGWPKRGGDASHFDTITVPHRASGSGAGLTDADLPDADVIVATWWETAEWVSRCAPAKGAKAYFIQGYEMFDYLPTDRVKATWRLPLHKITISRWLVDLAEAQYGDRHVSLVPNRVDLDQFHAPPRGRQPKPTVGMIYYTSYWKGCDVGLKAFQLAAEKIPGLRMVSFGTGTLSPDLPLPPGTTFVRQPPQASIKDLYAQCDVWLCGSWSEGFHLPILEAMACRTPVVSTAVGCAEDVIENGVNGYSVPVGDSEQLAQRLVDLLSLPEADWRQMSEAAHHTATRSTWDDAAEEFEAALQTAIARSQQGACGV